MIPGVTPLRQLRRKNARDQTEVSTTINGRSASFYSRNRGQNRSSRMPLPPLPFFDTGCTRATLHPPSRVSYDDVPIVVPAPANPNRYEDSSASFALPIRSTHNSTHAVKKCNSPLPSVSPIVFHPEIPVHRGFAGEDAHRAAPEDAWEFPGRVFLGTVWAQPIIKGGMRLA